MNTKTMRLPPRRVLTPSGPSNKRKERDEPFDRPKSIPAPPINKLPKPDKPIPWPISEPKPSNQLLAGYLAHEFLTKGTLLGQPWAPPKGKSSVSTEDGGEEGEPTTTAATAAATPCRKTTAEERERYAEVAGLLKGGGTHFPGVVNPTQLARFLHL
ncbi:uncharacterized protein LOC114380933 [Glycine soja]|uniref:Embryo sac development arrest 6 n=1 Tax=Glycine soja TaxID=3848 RepID=A0A445HF17_GLYSO|nr:uncharacterized protein LOC114380933 [Glycine soja]RZB72210.1 hypothetical protein D0Y65_036514 [Glycine soja]